MELLEHFKGYFEMTEEQRQDVIAEVMEIYITQMKIQDKKFGEIMDEVNSIIKISEEKEDFEISEGFSEVKKFMELIQQLFQQQKI